MEIKNAKIANVIVGIDDRDRLSAIMSFKCQSSCCGYGFILTNPTDSERLLKLLNYTDSYNVQNLNGRIVRVVKHDGLIQGFGHPIEDKFVPLFGKKLTEKTELQFEELLKN